MEVISESQLDRLKELVLYCGDIMTAQHGVEDDNGDITVKPGTANFVTVFDVKIQNTLIKGLSEIFPSARFFAEEKDNSSVDISTGMCFIIDPIDGTTNFIHEMNRSGIMVGMLYNGTPYLGAIYDPYKKEYYIAVRGKGAFCNGSPIHVSDRPLDVSLVSFGTSPYRKEEFADISFRKAHDIYVKCADLRRSGSAALDLYNVAAGRLDAFFEFTLSPWDYAAGVVLVTEAGGKITAFDGSEVTFDKASSMLCTNSKIHEEIRKILCE